MSERVEIEGLRELRLGLRGMDKKLPREIRKAGNKAVDVVVRTARPRVPIGPGRGGHAASSIKAASTQSFVGVAEGGKRYPYMPLLDFGGTWNRHTGHPNYRLFIRKGRYIWRSFADHRQQVLDGYQDAVAEAARGAGLDVT